MRICLVADYSEPDEARKVIAHNLSSELSKKHSVLRADIRNLFSFDFWRNLRNFKPEIIHYIPGASPFSFWIIKLMKHLSGKPRTVMFSMLNPFHSPLHSLYYLFSYLSMWTILIMKSDIVIVQSRIAEKVFNKLGCATSFVVCSGVDSNRFIPATETRKEEWRKKYGVDQKIFAILHIGSIRKWRNVEVLKRIRGYNGSTQFILVGRTSTELEKGIALELEKVGCRIMNKYQPNIEELYALADCYVFPTTDPVGSIDIPLSVLEAMAANLPVISTRFGGLPEIFEQGDGLFFFEREEELVDIIKTLRSKNSEIKTREKVISYSWENIAKNLERVYQNLLTSRPNET